MFRADRGDLLAGLIIAAVGGWFLVGAFDYRIGTAVRMGPGYLPMVFGIITLVLGLAIMLLALGRSEEHTSELQSLMRISYAVFCLKTKNTYIHPLHIHKCHNN